MNRIKTEVKVDNNSKSKIEAVKKPVTGFMAFLNKYSILSLAIGVVIGQATKDTVNILVSGIITPAIEVIIPKSNLQDLIIDVNGAEFKIGEFFDSLIQMILILAVIYFVVGVMFKREDLIDKKKKKSKKKSKKKNK